MLKNNLLVFVGIFLVSIIIIPTVLAETDDDCYWCDCSTGSYGDLCKESEYVIWDKNRPLTWADFQGIPDSCDVDPEKPTDFTACTSWSFDWWAWWEKSNNTPCEYEITKLNVATYFNKFDSWVVPDDTEISYIDLLKHEQGHFDIAQIHVQEFKAGYEGKTFACPSGVYDNDEIYNEITNHWIEIYDKSNAISQTYDKETDHYWDKEGQAEWNKKIISLLSTGGYVKEVSIPAWIKNNAGWWAAGSIDDGSFLGGISYLIQNGIIVIPPTDAGTEGGAVPEWVKNTAGWWADGTIDDGTFVNAIQYLIKEGLIQV